MSLLTEIIFRARDGVTGVVKGMESSVGGLGKAMAVFGSQMGPVSSQVTAMAGAVGATTPLLLGLGAALGAIVGGFKVSAEMGKLGEELSNLSQRSGMGVEAVQELGKTFEDAGLSQDQLTMSSRFLNRAIAGNSDAFGKLHVSLVDANGVAKSTEDVMLSVADVFQSMPDGPNKTAAAIALFGRSGEAIIPVLNKGGAAIREYMKTLKDMGDVLDTDTVTKLAALDDRLDLLHRRWEGFTLHVKVAVEETWTKLFMGSSDADYLSDLKKQALAGNFDRSGSGTSVNTDQQAEARALELFKQYRGHAAPSGEVSAAGFGKGYGPGLTDPDRTARDSARTAQEERDLATQKAQQDAADKRETRLKAIMQLLEVGHDAAVEYASALDRVEAAAKKAEMVKSLRAGGVSDVTLAQSGVNPYEDTSGAAAQRKTRPAGMKADGPVSDPVGYRRNLEALLSTTKKTSEAMIDLGVQWSDTISQMFKPAQIMNDVAKDLLGSLQGSLASAMSGMLSGATSFASAVQSIFSSMVSAVINELAKLAALQIVKVLLQLSGVPVLGMSTNPADYGGSAGLPLTPKSAGRAFGSGATGDTYNTFVNTIDAKSLQGSATAPSGSFNQMNQRLANIRMAAAA